jgi:hypothetical protein
MSYNCRGLVLARMIQTPPTFQHRSTSEPHIRTSINAKISKKPDSSTMFGTKKSSVKNLEVSSSSSSTTFANTFDSDSISTIKPTQEREKRGWREKVRESYLKFEAKTPHGKDRVILRAREEAGVRTEKMGEKIYPRVMIWQSAPWGMGGGQGV